MVNKTNTALIDHAIKLITESGLNIVEASNSIGIHKETLRKHLVARGIKVERKIKNLKELPDNEIISLYESGLSELELSKRFNVSRACIRNRLKHSTVKIRGQSEANIVSMGRMTFEQRQDRTRKANNALRGSKQSVQGREKRASGIEMSAYEQMIGFGEKDLKDALNQRGIDAIWQKSCGIYNIDLAVGNVAVELKSGSSHLASSDKKRGRIKDLRESGFVSLYICFDCVDSLLQSIDYIISNINILNSNPPPLGEYRVIRCRTDRFTRFRNELGQFSAVPSTPKLFNGLNICNY